MKKRLHYRLALDLGSTSLGWAMIRLDGNGEPCAIIKCGVRIFPDGRNPQDGSSLAVTRREERAQRRRRDRLVKRKNRLMANLIRLGFFPADEAARRALELLDPYALRAKGLDQALSGPEFARALFHINQRRGFKSNRKTDSKPGDKNAAEASTMKIAIASVRQQIVATQSRTVGEWLHKRNTSGQTVRARYREKKVPTELGKTRTDKSYDLYIDRAMISAEFDAIWARQAEFNPTLFNEAARSELRYTLLFQRPLKPVIPGRCTLLPDEERAPLALPSQQRFRIYQELANLRLLRDGLDEQALTTEQRDLIALGLDAARKVSFTQIKKLLGFRGAVSFNLEDAKRADLKGNQSGAELSSDKHFGKAWLGFADSLQDEIVMKLLQEQDETELVRWLQAHTGVDEARAESIANVGLPDGYGSLSAKALARVLPKLRETVCTFDKAVVAAGFESHSALRANSPVPGRTHVVEQVAAATGEIKAFHVWDTLPYYGEPLKRHVGFGTGVLEDSPEKRFGKIPNPTVHIGLNQVRVVVNALIKRYGHPNEVIVELARELKQSKAQRDEDVKRQAENQKRNTRRTDEIAKARNTDHHQVRHSDLQKMQLWEELSSDIASRCCPYSGVHISLSMLLSPEIELEHILPFSETLDDSLNNKTVCMRLANRVKGNRTPWQAREAFAAQGWAYEDIVNRASQMDKGKRYRFAQDGYEQWLRDDKGFLARALNDTRYLSRVATEYLALICPQDTRVIPGRMTAMLRAKLGLNDILGLNGIKNRNDHRHHAVDACVIAITDQGMLQRFAQASAAARDNGLNRLVDNMPEPWPTYRAHVERAVNNIWVSHKPDHGHEGAMHNDTAYRLRDDGQVVFHKMVDGKRTRIQDKLKVIAFADPLALARHGQLPDGSPRPYKGYKGDSNYCIEIVRTDSGRWEGEVISTFQAYQVVRTGGNKRLLHPKISVSGKSLVMRLIAGDTIRLQAKGVTRTVRIANMTKSGQFFMADLCDANADERSRKKIDGFAYLSKYASSLQIGVGRKVTVSPLGELRDPGFKP